MIREGYFAKHATYPPDEHLICVSRTYPRYVKRDKMTHMKRLAPNRQLLDDYKNNQITWGQYTERYHKQMNHTLVTPSLLELMLRSNHGEDIRLLCYEKAEDRRCHRFLLLDILGEMGATVEPQTPAPTANREKGK